MSCRNVRSCGSCLFHFLPLCADTDDLFGAHKKGGINTVNEHDEAFRRDIGARTAAVVSREEKNYKTMTKSRFA